MKHTSFKKLLMIGLVLTLLFTSVGFVYAAKPAPETPAGNVTAWATDSLYFSFTWSGTVANAVYVRFVNESNQQFDVGVWHTAKRTSSGTIEGGANISTLSGSGAYHVECTPVIYNFAKTTIRVQGPTYYSNTVIIAQ